MSITDHFDENDKLKTHVHSMTTVNSLTEANNSKPVNHSSSNGQLSDNLVNFEPNKGLPT